MGTVVEASLKINDTTPPAVKDVEAVSLLPQITVRFSEPLDKASAENVANYRFSGKAKVASAELAPDGRSVMLTLSAPPEDAKFMLTVLGVRDRSPAGNPVPQVSIGATCARPVAQLKEATLDGQGGGVVDQPLEPGAPTAAASPWTINLWLWVNAQPENHTLIAGFGDGKTPSGVQRYLAKFPHGLHFWAANVDVPTKTALEVEKWQMLTATFDGEVVKVYKDGVEVAGQKVSLSDAAPIARIGPTGPWDYAHKLAGKVAGFALWNQALSPASVAALHKLGTQAEPPPKVEPPAKAEQPGKAKPAEDK